MLKRKYSEALGDKTGSGMIRLKACPGVRVSPDVMEGEALETRPHGKLS